MNEKLSLLAPDEEISRRALARAKFCLGFRYGYWVKAVGFPVSPL